MHNPLLTLGPYVVAQELYLCKNGKLLSMVLYYVHHVNHLFRAREDCKHFQITIDLQLLEAW